MSQPSSILKNHHTIILAAGHSSRMGVPKWKLSMPSGETFLEYIVREYSRAGIAPVVVVNDQQEGLLFQEMLPENLQIAVNPHPEKGRMYSLQCGLGLIKDAGPCFVHNIDNPFVSSSLIEKMAGALQGHDYLVPVCKDKGGHPLLINEKVATAVLNCPEPLPVLRDFLKNFNGYRMDFPDERILLNINTPQAYRSFLSIPG
ncbi:MAG: hypothetical protein EA361_09285 [Bacteroidetes bacterium]|nr:MAG: hypothetical protein EA361_09285 [Bacteroidota bacterium]